MNLRQLYYFKKIAELEHYTRAAKELFVSQSSLSHAIQELESELNVKFFEKKVFLKMFVKVDPAWRENKRELKRFGYIQ